jgi:hypothetical protein
MGLFGGFVEEGGGGGKDVEVEERGGWILRLRGEMV